MDTPMTRLTLAFDRAAASSRSYDDAGRLHVRDCRISKACISPYLGREIPGWDGDLGLDPDATYQLLRDADELRRAAPTFSGIPIFDRHKPATAADHPTDIVIGAVGTNVRFDDPWLIADLVFWPAAAIDLIETGEAKDLSCGYGFTAAMEPIVFQGSRADGTMYNLVGNHLALIPAGRVPGAMVGDAAFHAFHERTSTMRYPSLRSLCCDAAAIVKRRRARDQEGDPTEEDLDAPLESGDLLKLVRAHIESIPAGEAEQLLEQLGELRSEFERSEAVDTRTAARAHTATRAHRAGDRHRLAGDALPGIRPAHERFKNLGRITVMG
jgi:hypothetical protein